MTTNSTSQLDAIAALEGAGLRITEQRRQIVAAINRRNGGFTAEELATELANEFQHFLGMVTPKSGPATAFL